MRNTIMTIVLRHVLHCRADDDVMVVSRDAEHNDDDYVETHSSFPDG